mmetsp:Transcript_41886/g.112384  ORF Transcript_41886/g.112384 Transcript_41886/m.112384 type:complete len:200 (+) Transcript_41886:429-1028(+)
MHFLHQLVEVINVPLEPLHRRRRDACLPVRLVQQGRVCQGGAAHDGAPQWHLAETLGPRVAVCVQSPDVGAHVLVPRPRDHAPAEQQLHHRARRASLGDDVPGRGTAPPAALHHVRELLRGDPVRAECGVVHLKVLVRELHLRRRQEHQRQHAREAPQRNAEHLAEQLHELRRAAVQLRGRQASVVEPYPRGAPLDHVT